MVSRWDGGLAIDKKVEFLLGLRKADQPLDLLPNLRELILLRNWIVHGKVYRTEILIERTAEVADSGLVHLRADGDEWAPKFPHFKFPMPDRLSYPEARAFFLGVCSTMHHLSRACGFGPVLVLGNPPSIAAVVFGSEADPIAEIAAHLDTPTNAST